MHEIQPQKLASSDFSGAETESDFFFRFKPNLHESVKVGTGAGDCLVRCTHGTRARKSHFITIAGVANGGNILMQGLRVC